MKICAICQARFHSSASRCPLDGGELATPPDPLMGLHLAGRYVVQEKIGSGGMGSVYRAHHEVLDRPVAIKFLAPTLTRDPINRTRFLREARAANRVNHEHIVDITDFGETDGGRAYLVMEYLDGVSLSCEIAHGAIEPARALRIALQTAQALARAHELGVIHRDIKPENIFLLRGYDTDFVKLLDFGLARVNGELRVTATGAVFGTPEYIAPEQASGGPIGPATDLYALGVVLFEMLTGELPFAGSPAELLMRHVETAPPPPSSRLPTLSPTLDALVLNLLSKEPATRPASAYELVETLQGVLSDIPEQVPCSNPIPSDRPGTPMVTPTREQPAVEDRWANQVERLRGLASRAYRENAPAWLTAALTSLEDHLGEMKSLRKALDARAAQMTQQEEQVRELRLKVGDTIDALGRDLTRIEVTLSELDTQIDVQRRRLADSHETTWSAWLRVPHVDRERTGLSTEFLARAAEAGRQAALHLAEMQSMSDLEQQLRVHRAKRDELSFQIDQLKGRLGSLGAERELTLDALRHETSQLDRQLRERMEDVSNVADQVTSHLFAEGQPPAADTLLD